MSSDKQVCTPPTDEDQPIILFGAPDLKVEVELSPLVEHLETSARRCHNKWVGDNKVATNDARRQLHKNMARESAEYTLNWVRHKFPLVEWSTFTMWVVIDTLFDAIVLESVRNAFPRG
ncbi:MAG: hypothetical protein GY703_17360 [Gammaproteobacteria bacterium]|nr:hypothetical protein [Gammaproteobacteria bacterium]